MGVLGPDVSFLLTARALGVSFERTLTIGRQELHADALDLRAAYAECGLDLPAERAREIASGPDRFADGLFRDLGAEKLDSVDASGYEGSTLVHDLNLPLPAELHQSYSAVFDGGSLEHVFDVVQGLRNCLSAVEVGGHFVSVSPANGYFGHGFYQFSPELFQGTLSEPNGFSLVSTLVRTTRPLGRWYEVEDPANAGARVTMTSRWPVQLYVVGKRVRATDVLAEAPHQAHYVAEWAKPAAGHASRRAGLKSLVPTTVRRALRTFTWRHPRRSGPGHFRRVKLAELATSGNPGRRSRSR